MTQQPDAATARNSGGGFTAHSEGQHAVTCVDVVNLGWKIEQFPGKPEREVEKAALVFASGERHTDHSLRLVTVEMTLSMGDKANMRKFLESWRGKAYRSDQVIAGVPLDRLQGQHALVSIEHVQTRAGNTFAKVISVSPLPKAMPAPDPSIVAEYTRPEFFETRKAEYAKAVAAHRTAAGAVPLDERPSVLNDEDDDLPF